MTVRRRARRVAANPGSAACASSSSSLPTEFLDPDDPMWHDDRRDLALKREFHRQIPAEVAEAICRLGRWKRLIAAADRFAVEQGWVNPLFNADHPVADHKRMAAAGVPLMAYRRERKRLVALSMWSGGNSTRN